jgi:hypothetical protein
MVRRKSETRAVAKWDAQLAEAAKRMQDQAADFGGGRFISVRGGQLSIDGDAVPGNRIAVVVLYSLRENVYYDGDFDPDDPQTPLCFAFDAGGQLAPHADAQDPQCDTCKDCRWAEWGSAARGRGKACRNRIRLAVLAAGKLDGRGAFEAYDDPKHFAGDAIYQLSVPPTSGKIWRRYLGGLGGAHPATVFTLIDVVPDPKDQWHFAFERLDRVPDRIGQVLVERLGDAHEAISQPYQLIEREEQPRARRGKNVGRAKSGGRPRAAASGGVTSTRRKTKTATRAQGEVPKKSRKTKF